MITDDKTLEQKNYNLLILQVFIEQYLLQTYLYVYNSSFYMLTYIIARYGILYVVSQDLIGLSLIRPLENTWLVAETLHVDFNLECCRKWFLVAFYNCFRRTFNGDFEFTLVDQMLICESLQLHSGNWWYRFQPYFCIIYSPLRSFGSLSNFSVFCTRTRVTRWTQLCISQKDCFQVQC